MKRLGIVIAMAVAVAAYREGRRSVLPWKDVSSYKGLRQHSVFRRQHHPLWEQSLRMQQYQSYRPRFYRRHLPLRSEQLPFKDRSSLGDYSSLRYRPFYGDSSSFRDSANLKRQTSFYLDGSSFRDEQYMDQTLKNGLILGDQYSYQPPSFRDDARFADLYDKPSSSYKEKEQSSQPVSLRDSEYLKHGNHGLGYVSAPPVSPYENVLPLNREASTTTKPSTTTQKSLLQQSTVSTASPAITQVHASATSAPKTASQTSTMPSVKSDTLVEGTAMSTSTLATMSAAGLTAKQSSNLANQGTALTTSLPVVTTKSPILSLSRQTISPIESQAGKSITPASYYITNGMNSKFQQSLLDYLLSQQTKSPVKSTDQTSLLNYELRDALNSSSNNKIQGQPLNYVLPEKSKVSLKENLLHYLLQSEPDHDLSVQRSSLSDPVNYVPLAEPLAERSKLVLPSVPIATLSAISRPLRTGNYVSPALPKVSALVTQESPPTLSLARNLPSSLAPIIPITSSTSVFNSLPSEISGISTNIPSSVTPTASLGIPTLNLGQNFQHIGQLRQFEAPRSQPTSYSTGLLEQLSDCSGMDYTLRSSNPVAKPLEFGISKVGLNMPELLPQQLPTFSKIAFGQHVW